MKDKIQVMLNRVDRILAREQLGAIGVLAKRVLAREISKLTECKECNLRKRANETIWGKRR